MDIKTENTWYIGIALDESDKKKDKIEMIEFYNSVNNTVHVHTSSGQLLPLFDIHNKLIKLSLESWKKDNSVCFSIPYEKFEKISVINTSIHDSLKKFLKAFSFEEYMI